MTYEMMQDIASEVINEAEFVPGVKLFDLDPDDYFDEYCVADSDCGKNTMPLGEFLVEYTNKLLKALDRIK